MFCRIKEKDEVSPESNHMGKYTGEKVAGIVSRCCH